MFFRKKKKHCLYRGDAGGFTLIEVVVVIILVAFLGTMLVAFMSSNLSGSVLSVNRVQKTYDLGAVMENITGYYKQKIVDQDETTPLATIKTSIGAAGSTYSNSYGSYKVIENGYITFTCSGSSCTASTPGETPSNTLKVKIADPAGTQAITALFPQ